jgi:hypothetical protein
LLVSGRRRPPALVRAPRVALLATGARTARDLVRAIADLDAQFEHHDAADPGARARYEAQRSALKTELAGLLAGIGKSTQIRIDE